MVHTVMFRLVFKRHLIAFSPSLIYATLELQNTSTYIANTAAQAEIFELTGKDSTISPVICKSMYSVNRILQRLTCTRDAAHQ